MARDPQMALVALNRFGFGARGGAAGDFVSAASDPRGFVKAELARANGALLELPGLQSTPALGQALFAYQLEVKAARDAVKAAEAPPAMDGNADAMSAGNTVMTVQPDAPKPPVAQPPPNVVQKVFTAEALARIQRATIADGGFVERLVTFWSNHFCISASKGEPARIWAGSFEREAIRPFVLGKFAGMLRAVEQHPAMLFFLDNQQSIGPESKAGQRGKRGLNENLAREIMELHTLGVGAGYTQADVTALARIITGWTFAGRDGKIGLPGSFAFNANAHQPGPQLLLGKSYDDAGVGQGEAALADIARHPATAKFIAHKFAQHFVADTPPPALVAKLQAVFSKTDGDLKALALALVDSDEAWTAPLTKMRLPYEYLIATGRILGRIPEEPNRTIGSLAMMGQPLWTPPGPNGFADSNAAWAAPEGLKLRLDIAAQVSSKIADSIDARDLLEVVAGEAASNETRQTIARAETRQQALALLLMSPEFQRR
ncbi:DUF1800 family protein [Tardiphaga sp. vice352]|uniref:DUF1800 domain-containing protein n=1 Tax=unclassified Tardiphaga TaxID=2631404 RepID=UPI0011650D0E|nr:MULTISPECIES: DUF1800 family protein [unclassified Tardiphaga]QDM18258.1 DUF1800 family protein [Tardiphaga sp. vice278]QDM23263.1 DUF1800 family protein [Tardiphaga sp. vice154]QDM28484.1 DUF1800 family protein [Tardiphaga sp. vice304]QDM33581.1 DUF1800 family protein [Tardiphaga sp. vice352]